MCAAPSFVEPVLTIVTASRNDDHGGDPLARTQLFINGLSFLASKHRRPIEIIIVDWNPVAGRPGLAGVLQLPASDTFCTGRVVTVPAELHRRYKYGDVLGFFQMIAKNVGIRRARGKFVLATNIDILFSDELFQFMTNGELRADRHYRVDRHDIAPNLPSESTLEQMLQHAWAKPIRTHRRFSPPELLKVLYPHRPEGWKRCEVDPKSIALPSHLRLLKLPHGWALEVEKHAPASDLHTNGCGDFALMSRDAWMKQRGYPEFEAFSFNIDSIGLMQSHFGGFTEVSLLPPYTAFHIEHSIGSGWTPEGERKLFARLNERKILNPDWQVLGPVVEQLRASRDLVEMNDEHWGLARFDLPEEPLLRGEKFASPPHPRASGSWPHEPVAAIRPEFDLDRLALWTERRFGSTTSESASRSNPQQPPHLVQLFWPNARGEYSEERKLEVADSLHSRRRFFFFVPATQAGAQLRLDPTYHVGVVELRDIDIICPDTGRLIWSAREHGTKLVHVGGTARILAHGDATGIRLLSTGDDPQLYLPPLPPATPPKVLVSVDVEFHAFRGEPT